MSRPISLLLCTVVFLAAATADELPLGVPNPIGTDGKYTHAMMFTTQAYQEEAFRLVLQEANQIAKELQLPEKLPITETNVIRQFIAPFGYAFAKKAIGNITTSNYWYIVAKGNKFSGLTVNNFDERLQKYEAQHLRPEAQINTNVVYQLATQWLAAVSIDVKALNQDCQVHIEPNRLVNTRRNKEEKFVPVYDVYWVSAANRSNSYGDVASVTLFAPTKTLLQLNVDDPKYILRPPLVFTNLAALFPGKATITTNWPVKMKTMAAPPPP